MAELKLKGLKCEKCKKKIEIIVVKNSFNEYWYCRNPKCKNFNKELHQAVV